MRSKAWKAECSQSRPSLKRSASSQLVATKSPSQAPITPAYAFTDYRTQAQTRQPLHCRPRHISDGQTHTFQCIHIALSRSHGRDGIRFLRDFDECLFTHHPSEHLLRVEDEQLDVLDRRTRKKCDESIPDKGNNVVVDMRRSKRTIATRSHYLLETETEIEIEHLLQLHSLACKGSGRSLFT